MKYRLVPLLVATLSLAISFPAMALDGVDDVGAFNSITVTRKAREAAKQAESGQWPQALDAYRQALGLDPNANDLNYGLYNSAVHVQNWNLAGLALEKIFEFEPGAKPHLKAEYGQVLTNQGRFDEAVPVLKLALASPDSDQNYLGNKIKELMTKTARVVVKESVPLTAEELEALRNKEAPRVIPQVPIIRGTDVNVQKSKSAKSFENAFSYSEFIGICTFENYEKSDDISFFNPPRAHFHIDKILKGPNLNKEMPVRFEFHDKTATEKPEGWEFSDSMMPKKGSKWILFTDAAIPTQTAQNSFETFRGNYGRMEATKENLDEIYRVRALHQGQ